MNKIVHVGRVEEGRVFCRINYDGKRLSISGAVEPKSNGDAASCGQIIDYVAEIEIDQLAPGWTSELRDLYVDVWKCWHLNDMRAGCEHQHAGWYPEQEIVLVTYRLNTEIFQSQQKIQKQAQERLAAGETVTLTLEEQAILALPLEQVLGAEQDGGPNYTEHKRETKAAGWVYPKEHPEGLLTRACTVCGYKYGSAWLHEDVPADVLAFLAALPETDVTPAWC